MTARITIEFTENFIEMIKEESGYTNPEAIAAFLKGLFVSEYENMDTKLFIKDYIIEVK